MIYLKLTIMERVTYMQPIILGSYTRKDSKGVYQIQLDEENDMLIDLKNIIQEDNSTYLDTAQNNDFLYTVAKDGENGGIAAYQLDGEGNYSLINRVMLKGAPPCYVAVDGVRQLVYGANYHQGIVTSYKIEEDGSLTLADKVQHTGDGPHANQDGPHAHYADLTPDDRLVACDLGNDTVYTYNVSRDGKLTEVAKFHAKPGTGPRHLVFHPKKPIAYLFGELSSDIVVLSYNGETGEFTEIETVSTLPEGFNEFNGGAAIRITKDGKYLYASNRGHNSVVVYRISDDGKHLETVEWVSVEGDFPRDFNLSEDEEFVVVANQKSDNLTLFKRQADTGKLILKQKDIYAPEVVCVKFI